MAGPARTKARPTNYVGRSMLRVEDDPLLRGNAGFVDDLNRDGQLTARVVRSPVAHGRIVAIDTAAARALPGVVAVVTGEDVPDVRIPIRMMPTEAGNQVIQPVLARGEVRYVGEPVAVVVADDPYVAEDAAEEVGLDIEELPAILDTSDGTLVDTLRPRWGADLTDLEAIADVVVSDRLLIQRHAAIPMETRGLIAEFDPDAKKLTVWGPTKVKHFNRTLLAGFFDLPEESVRLVEPDVGGGFGARGEFYPEDFLVPWLAMHTGRPIKWVEDRREHFLSCNHSRETACEIDIGATADGRLVGMRARCLINQGAYARTHGALTLPWILLHHLPGPYRWDGVDLQVSSVLSNKTPSGTYRGPCQFEGTFFRERMLDRVAVALDMDPVELRRRNLITTGQMPFVMELSDIDAPLVYDNGDFPHVMQTLGESDAYAAVRADTETRRAGGELVGVGLANYVEQAAFGRFEWAWIHPRDGGGWTARVGIASVGQGVRTALAQVVADQLGVPFEDVDIVYRDTDLVPHGFGAFGSRTTIIGGGAVIRAIDDLKRKAIAAAAEQLEIAEADLEVVPGAIVQPRGNPTRGLPIADLDCTGEYRFDKPHPSFDMGACVAQAAIDKDTGAVTILRIIVCHDVGTAVNPLLVDGQLVGAAAQGVGGTLLEELAYDGNGQPLSTSFMDYLMPTATEVPPVDAIQLDLPHWDESTANPVGAKSAGEGGIVGAGAAIANAVADALGDHDDLSRLPLRPETMLGLAGLRQRQGEPR